jgi:hypothetical protein
VVAKSDAAVIGLFQPGEQSQQSALSAAASPDNCEKLTWRRVQIEAAEDGLFAKGLGQSPNRDGRGRRFAQPCIDSRGGHRGSRR